jgi:ABC-type lipoprotein export system ATPase subunit
MSSSTPKVAARRGHSPDDWQQIMELFEELNHEGRNIVMITHDINIAKHAKRIVNILDGELTEMEMIPYV